jgi:hypothetical protein
MSDNETPEAKLMHKNRVIGSLVLPNVDDTATTTNIICELIAISEAEVLDEEAFSAYAAAPSAMWDVSTASSTYQQDKYKGKRNLHFYNVLWIEWENDIAYRKALGTVMKSHWDALEAETITFRFG